MRALPREIRQPIRIVMNPVRSVRRAVTPSIVRDARRLVNQVTNPVSAIARSAENALWEGVRSSPPQATGGPGRQTVEGFMLSAGEPGVELEYQCPFCNLSVLCQIPSYEKAENNGFRDPFVTCFTYWKLDRVERRCFFDVLCPHCRNVFRSWIIYEKKFGPYVYEPKPLFGLVIRAIGGQLGAMVAIIAVFLLLLLSDSAWIVLVAVPFILIGGFGLFMVPSSVVEHRFAEIKEHKKSTFLRRFAVRISAWLGSLGTAVAVVITTASFDSISNNATFRVPLIAFLVQAIAVIPISQFLAYYPFGGSGPLLGKASRSGKSEERARVTLKGKAGIFLGIGVGVIAVVLTVFFKFSDRDSGEKSFVSYSDCLETVTTKDGLGAHLDCFKKEIVNLQKLHSEIRWEGGESLTQVKDSVERVYSEVGLLIEGVTATFVNYPELTGEGKEVRKVLLGFEDYYRIMLKKINITEIRYSLFDYKEAWPPVVTAAAEWEKVLQRVVDRSP